MAFIIAIGIVAAAVVAGLIEFLLGRRLPPEKSKLGLRHIAAILVAVLVFTGIATWSSLQELESRRLVAMPTLAKASLFVEETKVYQNEEATRVQQDIAATKAQQDAEETRVQQDIEATMTAKEVETLEAQILQSTSEVTKQRSKWEETYLKVKDGLAVLGAVCVSIILIMVLLMVGLLFQDGSPGTTSRWQDYDDFPP